jgi:hypothetical protein
MCKLVRKWKIHVRDFCRPCHLHTDVKISQLVNKMCSQQACSKLACQQVVTCCYFIKLLQGCHSQLVDKLLNCRMITSCWNNLSNKYNLSTSWEQAVRTHPVDKLLEQHCYKSAAGLLQLVRFTCVDYQFNL